MITAKATFTVDASGQAELDSQAPYPLFEQDQPTEFGVMPMDRVVRNDPALEVIVLGAAYAPAAVQLNVGLTVGRIQRAISVSGERRWEQTPAGARLVGPEPFSRLPMTWDRAYGGSTVCMLDANSPFVLDHPLNRYGRGFDAQQHAAHLGASLKAPAGYPTVDYERFLPNLEHPGQVITEFHDSPVPYCWATVPYDIGLRAQQLADPTAAARQPTDYAQYTAAVMHRAHPDWIIDLPPAGSQVRAVGMTPEGSWTFSLPLLRVIADYELGDRQGERELMPQLLMLLPEEKRFYIVYRRLFTMDVSTGMKRSFRLRLADGWYEHQPEPAPGGHR